MSNGSDSEIASSTMAELHVSETPAQDLLQPLEVICAHLHEITSIAKKFDEKQQGALFEKMFVYSIPHVFTFPAQK